MVAVLNVYSRVIVHSLPRFVTQKLDCVPYQAVRMVHQQEKTLGGQVLDVGLVCAIYISLYILSFFFAGKL